MYLGDADLSQDNRDRLEALSAVTTRNMAQMTGHTGMELNSYASKPFSILLSSFREALFIDADCFFFQNPAALFDSQWYNETGALFFRDRRVGPHPRKEWLEQILPEPVSEKAMGSRFWTGESSHEQESGLILVDKWRHFVSLLLVTRLNGLERFSENGGAGVYEMVHGDKETFWLGWELAGDVDYSFHPGAVAGMGAARVVVPERGNQTSQADEAKLDYDVCKLCSSQLLHMDADGMPLWVNGWILGNKNQDPQHWEYGAWQHYAVEPPTNSSQGALEWELGLDNYCCITVACQGKRNFTEEQQAILAVLINKAMEVGASIRDNQTDTIT
ncbi:hypothetical protein JDV02_002953 [Purpureocillium takamizusanense]|uniref:Alpha-1,3-mannosyltransferase n=1 Tax=Purpureocillium takamizusanense TaxID=2060973 RepID=A0A9Q8QBF9_9HYPO|nr:uncharacterized protein JDV02_002953 [Purpureocillium takamizusanense]UNI16525.1 hypothetical protein JDV02_002953 [Purpureocillium takamizusanense]